MPGIARDLAYIKSRCIVNERGCWIWQGSTSLKGYGKMTYLDEEDGRQRTVDVHRYVYEYVHGKLEPGLCACHECDTRRCCNPECLFPGTMLDNMADAKAKGKQLGRNAHFISPLKTRGDI